MQHPKLDRDGLCQVFFSSAQTKMWGLCEAGH